MARTAAKTLHKRELALFQASSLLPQMLANLELNSKGLHLRLQKEKANHCLIIFTLCRGVASMYAHTPVRTCIAEIRRKMFGIISGKHSIVQTGLTDKFFRIILVSLC